MSIKILASNLIGLEAFCNDPVNVLTSTENGTVAIFDKNQPVFYAVTPKRLEQLLAYEASSTLPTSDVTLEEEFFDTDVSGKKDLSIPNGKYKMYDGWHPDKDFLRLASVWGIILTSEVTPAEIASFIDYWKAEGKFFYHTQWLQKFARSVQQGRIRGKNQVQRDLNHTPEPDQKIPDGFRG
ncbi:primosomal protein DnaT [Serratia marcescens]|uniref:Primosomal protein DnaT n=5 Tax=Serratia marcescens TaxID=615 RepID=A0ABX5NGT3_SERMA|nr:MULTISPECIES: primosomal protein DnaT [Serratia]MBX9283189.1 primosomal protein DnaT [Serratia marcescens]MBX9288747.1 primosomal protein DnaT [Serratia marcescens]MBX9290166.1 primosomal protein DnaT [Serratia marcescens]MBX9304230.1 primosomal protein DnaT [Serratia marcescens]MBX9307990.1 primosomal protein DnaT [Serratia marcescens]